MAMATNDSARSFLPAMFDSARLSRRWIALNRERTRTVAVGDSFDDVKRSAAAAGEYSVLLACVPTSDMLPSPDQVLHAFAVFISHVT